MKQFILKNQKKCISGVFVIIFLIGIFCFRDYGIPWDEPNELNILLSNLMEYSEHFGLLEHNSSLNALFQDVTPISESEELDHGEAIYYPVTFTLYLFQNSQYTMYKILHLYYFTIFFFALICLYFIVKKLTLNKLYALISTLFLFLSPRMFAESFYNNKDIVLMSLVIICFWFGMQLIDTKKIRFAVILGIIGAFTANLRIIGFYLLGLIGLLYLIHLIFNKVMTKRNILTGCLVIVCFFASFLLITPASWNSVPDYFTYVFKNSLNFVRWNGFVYYQGKIYSNQLNPLPWHYLPVMFGITTPLLIVLFTCISPVILARHLILNRKTNMFSSSSQYYLLCFFFIIPVLLEAMLAHPTMYNGWRHFYFLYGPALILVSLVLKTILDTKRNWLKIAAQSMIAIQFLVIAILIIRNHPNEYCYYNILAGTSAQKNYETDYWNVSAAQCLEQLIDTVGSNKPITVSIRDWHSEYGLSDGYYYGLSKKYKERIKILDNYSAESDNADYWIVNPMYQVIKTKLAEANLNYDEPPFDFSKDYKKVTSVKAFGNELFTAYTLK